ncbi:peptidylprolyl isomerase [Pararhodobacter oceanensis]|uniref:peptidylprolyl isomerase n=1 Tax=Pararhodobacter oceanensis TaxID=2172121 RepID=UPI003A903F6C
MHSAAIAFASTLSPRHRAASGLRAMLGALCLVISASAATLAPTLAPTSAHAQSPFSAAVYVNDTAISNYDVTQKMRFLEFIGASGPNPRERAIERLIEDRLQLQEVRRMGGRLTPDQLDAGMAEFSARAELTAEEMLARLAEAGIDRDTFVNFIRAGVMWREYIQAIYGPQLNITEAQIDQALSVEGVQPVTEVLISEIFLPADPQFAEAVERVIPQIQRIRSETEFANAARQVSASPSAASGGRVDRWVNIAALPPQVGSAMESAGIGTVVGPIEVPGAYAFFQLRARRNSRDVPASNVALTYYRAALPGGRSEQNMAIFERLRGQVDLCAGFPAEVLRAVPALPESAVTEITGTQAEINAATRAELERLNAGEMSANLVEGNDLVVLMLCRRSVSEENMPSREEVLMGLRNRALEGHGMIHLQRLRAEAEIRYP